MTQNTPNERTATGHIDNRATVWIVLILGGLAATYIAREKTGKGLNELFWSLPVPWPAFLLTLGAVVAVGLAVLVVVARLGHGTPLREVAAGPGDVGLVERAPAQRAGGAVVAALALTLVAFGLFGSGWFWGVVATVGVLLTGTAAALFTARTTWRLAPGEITREVRHFFQAKTTAWPVPDHPTFHIRETTTGGAFGLPLVTCHRVMFDEITLLESENAEHASALRDALTRTYPERGRRPDRSD